MRFRKRKEGEESERALAEAHENLKRTQARSPDVTAVTKALQELREKNHFAEQLQIVMGGSK